MSGRKKKLALGGAWSFDALAAELLALSSFDQRKPHSTAHAPRATYDRKDRLVMLSDAANAVEIDDWETPVPNGKSSGTDSGSLTNNTSTTASDGVTFAAPTGASDDDDDDDDESKAKYHDASVVITDGKKETKRRGVVDYDSDSDPDQPSTRMSMPDTSALALLDLSQSSIKVVRPTTRATGTSASNTTTNTSITGGLFAGANYPTLGSSGSGSSGRAGSNGSSLATTLPTVGGWTTHHMNNNKNDKSIVNRSNNNDLVSSRLGTRGGNTGGHTRQSSTSSIHMDASTVEEETASQEEVARRTLDNMARKQNNQDREIDDLEARYRFRALSRITPRLHQFNQQISLIGQSVDSEEHQRQLQVEANYKKARAVLREHHHRDQQEYQALIEAEEKHITNLIEVQKRQVIAAQAEEAIKRAADAKRIAEEKAAIERAAKEAAERKKKADDEAKRIADEVAARQRALEEKQKKDAADAKAAAAAPVPAKAVAVETKAPLAAAAAAPNTGGTNTVAYAEFQRRHAKLQAARAAADLFAENAMQSIQVKKTINLQINSLSATQEQIKLKTEALMKVLSILRAQPQQFAYGLVLCAQKILDIAIVRAPSLAFTFSYLAYELSQAVPDFMDIFVAYINERCLLTIPYYPEKKPGQSVADQQRALGYVVSDAGQAETETSFLQRTKAIMNVYAAFMQWPIERHTHGLSAAWLWVSRILNLEPRSATATVLLAFLETAGFNFLQFYPKQAPKIFALIETAYVPKLPQSNEERKAARHRVVLWLHEYKTKGGKLEMPAGMQLPRNQTSDTRIVYHQGDDRAT